jgi:uncharacterized protein
VLTESTQPSRPRAWQSRALEAQLLADLLRLSRVSVLYGPAGSGKTTLIESGVLPLVCRRHDDGAARRAERRVVVPFPERRRTGGARRGSSEIALMFDAWEEDPLAALKARLLETMPPIARHAGWPDASLARSLAAWHDELDLRFFIILDGFERYLAAPEDDSRILDFAHELLRVLNAEVPVNILISVREEAQAAFEAFQVRIPGFDEASFHLPALPPGSDEQLTHPRALSAGCTTAPERSLNTFDRLRARLDSGAAPQGGSARIEAPDAGATPPREAQAVPEDRGKPHAAPAFVGKAPPLQGPGAQNERRPAATETAGTAPQAPAAHVESPPAHSRRASADGHAPGARKGESRERRTRVARRWLAAAIAAAALPLVVWNLVERTGSPVPLQNEVAAPEANAAPTAATRVVHTPTAPASPPMRPWLTVVTERGNGTDAAIAADLARAVGPAAGLDLVVLTDGAYWQRDSVPRLALMRYEVLEAGRGSARSAAASESLRVIAPLYTEELHLIVRRDSPLRYIHEIRDARINLGPAHGDRAVTAARLYRGMFGASVPPGRESVHDDEVAIRKLLDGSLDVMMVVSAQPVKWLAELPAELARSIRLLELDPAHPASERAIELYLPAVVQASSYARWLERDTATLATMSFLVTPDDSDPAFAERLEEAARSLCRALPELRRAGHPKWREVDPGFEVDVGWSYSRRVRAAFQSCVAEGGVETAAVRTR